MQMRFGRTCQGLGGLRRLKREVVVGRDVRESVGWVVWGKLSVVRSSVRHSLTRVF